MEEHRFLWELKRNATQTHIDISFNISLEIFFQRMTSHGQNLLFEVWLSGFYKLNWTQKTVEEQPM